MAYSKLHSTIVNSSLWCEPDHVRLLFITLLAMADKDGCVYGSRGGIENAARLDLDDFDECDPWHVLLSPDRDSSDKMRAPEHEGRRIEEIPGGFRLLNFAYYRGLRNDDDRREQNRIAKAKHRARQSAESAAVSQGKPPSAKGSRGKPQEAHTEAEADTEAVQTQGKGASPPALAQWLLEASKVGLPEAEATTAFHHYESNGWKQSSGRPIVRWQSAVITCRDRWRKQNEQGSRTVGGRSAENPRNVGIVRGPTDYAAAAQRRREQAEKAQLDRQMAADATNTSAG